MNGTAHGPRARHVATMTPAFSQDPMHRIDALGEHGLRAMVVGILVALAVHGVAAIRTAYIHAELIAWVQQLAGSLDGDLTQTIDIVPEKVDPPPPPPPEQKDDSPPPPPPPTPEAKDTPPPPPAPAEAGKILAANPDNQAPLDLTNTFVQGTGDSYAGGVTQATGTSKVAVHTQAVSPRGVPGGRGPVRPQQAVAAANLSRPIQLAGSSEWHCPFPPEADADQIDEAAAVVSVTVGPSGRPQRVTIVQDPGHGFGREARACALRESYSPALDRAGNAVVAAKSFRVRFER